jgi:hypothetical protein
MTQDRERMRQGPRTIQPGSHHRRFRVRTLSVLAAEISVPQE